MTATEPQVNRAGRYPVMDAARIMECDRRTLAKYAAYFGIAPRFNRVNNRAFYTGEQLLRIWRASF